MTDNTTTDFFDGIGGGSGAPGAVLKNVGDQVYGEILDLYKRDYIPFGAKDPEKRDDGTNKQQLVIILQTAERNWANVNKVPKVDPADDNSPEKPAAEDDGKRAVYVPEGKNIQFAIGRACQTAKAKPEVGGTLGVKVFNLKPTDKGNPLKEHQAVYTPPSASAGFFDGAQAPQQQAAPAAAPAPAAPAPQAAPAQQAAPAASQDPWASTPAPAQQAAPAASQDPWASPAGSAGQDEPPF